MRPEPARTGASFRRRRAVRAASGVASAGLALGFSFAGATPATAALPSDCDASNTLDGASDSAADIQALLDATTPVICLTGTFVISAALEYNYSASLLGLSDAVLDSDGTDRILLDVGGFNSLTVENIRFTGGTITGDYGGAIQGYAVAIIESTFDSNYADAGAAVGAPLVYIENSTFTGNSAEFAGAVLAADVTVVGSSFDTNFAIQGGGAILSYGVLEVSTSTFTSNRSGEAGGAIVSIGTTDIQNTTFVGNSSPYGVAGGTGGAVALGQGQILQSTFRDNSASASDGGQSLTRTADGEISLRGNIFAAGAGKQLNVGASTDLFTDLGGNLFTSAAATETGLGSVQPSSLFDQTDLAIFGAFTLADNGGPSETIALPDTSPAIDAVTADPSSLTLDQRGAARDTLADAGAYEHAPLATDDGGGLAATGVDPAPVGGFAALVLAAGVAVAARARRARV